MSKSVPHYKTEPSESMTLKGATIIADRVREYWRKAGEPLIAVWTEPLTNGLAGGDGGGTGSGGRLYVVRSNVTQVMAAKARKS